MVEVGTRRPLRLLEGIILVFVQQGNVAQMHEKNMSLPSGQATNNSGTGDGGVADGDDVLEFSFEDTGDVVSRFDVLDASFLSKQERTGANL